MAKRPARKLQKKAAKGKEMAPTPAAKPEQWQVQCSRCQLPGKIYEDVNAADLVPKLLSWMDTKVDIVHLVYGRLERECADCVALQPVPGKIDTSTTFLTIYF